MSLSQRFRDGTAVNTVLLSAILLHNLAYPLTTHDGVGPALFYLFYASMFVLAVWALSDVTWMRVSITLCGAAVLIAGLCNSYAPNAIFALAVYVTSIGYHALMGLVLARYTFGTRKVMTDVVLAATSLYLVIGSGFAAIHSLIEWIQPGSYATISGLEITWQQLLYFSFVTMTTLGYGDVTPVGFYAQAFAAFEAVLGVLYTVVLLARLVGLHATR